MERIILTPATQAAAIARAAEVLAAGGLVLYPTETIYGVGVDACNPRAVSKLLAYKNRPAGKAISVLVKDQAAAEKLVDLSDSARQLYRTFLPGPVTVISRSRGTVDARLQSELGTLGIRMSSHPVAQALAVAFGGPLTATSANASGRAAPYSIDQALDALSPNQRGQIDLILDFGTLPPNKPSTVVDTTQATQEVVRGGALLSELHPSWVTSQAEQTEAAGYELMRSLLYQVPECPVVFLLEGVLGAGKTQFAQGIARALQVTSVVSSPTYMLVKEYQGKAGDRPEPVNMVHMDCWRLERPDPLELGLEEYLRPNTVVVVEWPADLLQYFTERREQIAGYHLHFEALDESTREIRVREI
jgi:L-threonylcarbamoyladenylate synthase